MTGTTLSADEGRGTLTASTENFSLKSQVDADGQEKEYVQGFLATTHRDKGNDVFTEEALKMMAKDITQENDTVDAVFNDVDQEALKEAQVGNLDHNNNPGAPFGDTRIVPAFKVVDAQVRSTPDGEKGLWIKGALNTGMLPETLSAVKNSIKNGFLNAFSIEFIPQKVRQVEKGNAVVRIIEKAAAKGAALTGRPMNPEASMTGSTLKSMASEYKVEYAYSVGDKVSWSDTSGTVRDRTKDSCFNTEIDGDVEVCGSEDEPAYLIEVDNDEGTMVGHKQGTLSSKGDYKAELSESERTPPEAAKENAQMALDAKEETDNPNDCGTSTGWGRAEQLAEGGPVSEDVISKMSQFARHEGNKEQGEEGRADCGWMMWKAWGGDEGVEWAQRQMDKIEDKNDITTMTDEQPEQEPEESGAEEVKESGQEEEETKSFSEDVEELKSTMEDVKERNDELAEENEELKSELDDLKELQEVKSDLDEVKSLVEDIELEDGPRARQDQKRFEEQETKAEWKQAADKLPEGYLDTEGKSKSNLEAFAETHNIKTEEVKNYVNKD